MDKEFLGVKREGRSIGWFSLSLSLSVDV